MTKLLGVKLLEGQCKANGQWEPKKQLPGQSYIQHPDVGWYRVYHNLGKRFNIGLSLLGQPGIIKVVDVTNSYFAVEITVDGVYTDLPFYMSLSEVKIDG